MLDLIDFAKKQVSIKTPTDGSIQFDPWDCQTNLLKDFLNNRFNLVLHARQTGVTTATLVYILWKALFLKDQRIGIIVRNKNWARNYINSLLELYNKVSFGKKPLLLEDRDFLLEFSNGSYIYASTLHDTGCGESLTLAVVEQAAFIENADDMWVSLYPTLEIEGSAIISSCAHYERGLFYDLWTNENQFNKTKLLWSSNPKRNSTFIKHLEKDGLSFDRINAEYFCEFRKLPE